MVAAACVTPGALIVESSRPSPDDCCRSCCREEPPFPFSIQKSMNTLMISGWMQSLCRAPGGRARHTAAAAAATTAAAAAVRDACRLPNGADGAECMQLRGMEQEKEDSGTRAGRGRGKRGDAKECVQRSHNERSGTRTERNQITRLCVCMCLVKGKEVLLYILMIASSFFQLRNSIDFSSYPSAAHTRSPSLSHSSFFPFVLCVHSPRQRHRRRQRHRGSGSE